MPMPWTYRHPEKEWKGFLADIREIIGTPSDNVAYTAAEGVLTAFRRRLDNEQVLEFADALPCIVRALFLQGWRLEDPTAWASVDVYTSEAQALRRDHNFAGDKLVEAVSFALHRSIGAEKLWRALDRIGPEARAFWDLPSYDAERLAFRFG